ncbi:hypothetical protein SZN_33026 [Streptomyces zinciresistens K42]|uniref:Histidine kinase/HSP90-like ATPase domain-containing protein n=1 Tax=Streptomyces zinciresistens K42 TaxID=700597 RepID=G2GM53_9ACTN|nr:hypothetical protein SZN_33026 [Streptomyces zinciresistens K42]
MWNEQCGCRSREPEAAMPTTEQPQGRTCKTKTFATDPASVADARTWVGDICAGRGVSDDLLFTIKLLVSEAASNAVTHSGSPDYTVVVFEDGYIEVWDSSSKMPRPRVHEVDSEGGRGLELMELLAPGYQVVEDNKGGKCVRFQPKETE